MWSTRLKSLQPTRDGCFSSASRSTRFAGLIASAVGCRSTDFGAVFLHSQREDIENLKSILEGYKHVFLVCIYEDHWEDRGPHEYSFHHFKATVVRTYQGNWRISERVAFVHGVDAPARATFNADAGRLVFLFTNEHTDAEMGFETDEFRTYDAELERKILFIHPKRRSG
jgi:hypothetical protein